MSSESTMSSAPEPAVEPMDIGPPSMARRAWIGFSTIVRKEITRFMRIWSQTLLPPAMTMTLYFLIFGQFIGSRIEGDMNGVGYVEFIMPGLIMMSVITNSFTNVVGSFFSSKFQRNVEELLVSPLPNAAILGGYVTGGVARGLLVGAVVTVVSFFFTRVPVAHPLLTIATVVLTAVLFSIAGFINAMYARKFDDISIVPTFVLTPLTYLGGVFYSIAALPEWAQVLSKANPILYMVNAFRYGILGDRLDSPDVPVVGAFIVVCLFIVGFAAWALWLLKRGTGIRS